MVISSLILVLFFGLSMAQDETLFPPITSENRSQIEMIQVLSQGSVHQLTWSPNGEQLAVTAEGGTWVYDVTQPDKPAHHLSENILRSYVVYAPHDDIYISYSPRTFCPYGHCEDDQQVIVRDANTHEVLHEIWGMTDISVQFSHDGELVAISSRYYGILIFRADSFLKNVGKDASEFYQCQVKTPAEAGSAFFSQDDTLITYTGARASYMMSLGDYSIWFWDTATCEVHLRVKVFEDDYESYPSPIANIYLYNPNGPYAIIQDFMTDNRLHIWDVQARADLGVIPDGLPHIWGFTPDNRHLLLKKEGNVAQIWHIETQTVTRSFDGGEFYTLDDTHLLMLRAGDLYRINTTDEILLRDDESDITEIHFSEDKQWLFLTYADGHMILWDWATDTLIERWDAPFSTNLSPDKSKIAWSDGGDIFVWDIAKREQTKLPYLGGTGGGGATWSATENTMVTYGNEYFVWHLTESGFEIRWRYSRDARLLDVADDYIMMRNNDSIEFLDAQNGELVTRVAPDDCDPSDSFCARWNAIRASRNAPQPKMIKPYVWRDGTLITVHHPDYLTYPQTYTIPDHIASQMDTFTNPQSRDVEEQVEWVIMIDGDLVVRFGYTVYNVTQDTAMRMGYVNAPDTFCRKECYPFPFYRIWFSQDGTRLFAEGGIESDPFSVARDRILSAWDIETGRHLYDIRGSLDAYVSPSHDEQYIFLEGSETYVGMGKTFYNRYAGVFDAFTGEQIVSADTYDDNVRYMVVSPKRRFVIVYSDAPRLWAVVEDEGVQP
jgi:WD40 repeat protein